MRKVRLSSVLAAVVVTALLAGAVVLGLRNEKAVPVDASENAPEQLPIERDYFETFRNDRNSTRALEISYLDEIIATSAADAETLADAEAQKLALVSGMEMEFVIESQIIARGFSDAAVTMHNGNINVIVEAEALSEEDVAVILDIVLTESDVDAGSVKVSCIQ